MNLKHFNKSTFALFAILILASVAFVPCVEAQQRTGGTTGGGGGGGNFGNAGGGNRSTTSTSSSSSSSSTTSSRDYPNSTLPGDATFQMDPETHSIIGITDDATLAMIQNVVSNLDRPKPQALIKVVFLEVQHDNDLDFGVEGSFQSQKWNLPGVQNSTASSDFGLAGLNASGAGQTIGQSTMPFGAAGYTMMAKDFDVTLRAIASASKVEVISRPSIMVRNNQPATIIVGQSVPLVQGISYPTLSSGPLSSISYQPVGIILQVTPFISKDGLVEMIVAPQISDISSQQVQISSNVFAPVIDQRSASTVVVTPDGQTVVIGGLMENDKTVIDSKIPVLGDIPLLGALFKHKQQAITKKELMIFLTPHIVRLPTQLASATAAEDRNAALSHKAFSEQDLNQFFDRLPVKPGMTTSTNGPAR
jgi:general secretion pathway protein D